MSPFPKDNTRSIVFVSARSPREQLVFIPDLPRPPRIISVSSNLSPYELKCTKVTPLSHDSERYDITDVQLLDAKMRLVRAGETITVYNEQDGQMAAYRYPYTRDNSVIFDGRYTPLPLKFQVKYLGEAPRGQLLVAWEETTQEHYVFLGGTRITPHRIADWQHSRQDYGFKACFRVDGIWVVVDGAASTFDGESIPQRGLQRYEHSFSRDGSHVLTHRVG